MRAYIPFNSGIVIPNSQIAYYPMSPNLLDLPVSVFAHVLATIPESTTTLRRIVSSSFYRSQIEDIRAEPDESRQQKLKKQLRAIAPVAWLRHRKADTSFDDRVAEQWPLLMGDIDHKDNPDVDMMELKHHLCRLPFVLLCAYSVRGGIWFIIRLPDNQSPETLAAHFRYIQKLFSDRYGIYLDKSKGGNPCHLRYVSYDPNPYMNSNAIIMDKTYTLVLPKPQPAIRRNNTKSDEHSLTASLFRFLESTTEGERHNTLLKAAILAGGFIAAGQLDEYTAIYALETVASNWPMFKKSQGTIRDGIRYGKQKPLYADK